jgi:hypothetical protein
LIAALLHVLDFTGYMWQGCFAFLLKWQNKKQMPSVKI